MSSLRGRWPCCSCDPDPAVADSSGRRPIAPATGPGSTSSPSETLGQRSGEPQGLPSRRTLVPGPGNAARTRIPSAVSKRRLASGAASVRGRGVPRDRCGPGRPRRPGGGTRAAVRWRSSRRRRSRVVARDPDPRGCRPTERRALGAAATLQSPMRQRVRWGPGPGRPPARPTRRGVPRGEES